MNDALGVNEAGAQIGEKVRQMAQAKRTTGGVCVRESRGDVMGDGKADRPRQRLVTLEQLPAPDQLA